MSRTAIPFLSRYILPLLLAAVAGHGPVAMAADSPIRTVTVVFDGQAWVSDAVMFAPVPPAIAWDVLTDFEHQAQWVPNVKESNVLRREGDNVVYIEQKGQAKFGA